MKGELNSISILRKALDAAWLRNQAISNNISNVDTPNYKAYRVKFEDMLKDAVENRSIQGYRTNKKHIPVGGGRLDNVKPVVSRVNNTSTREDGNNVDIDTEMANLVKNNIMYQALADQISGKFERLKNVINGGGR